MDAARTRIESLNPLVTVETIPSLAPLEPNNIGETLKGVDLVCITDSSREFVVRIPRFTYPCISDVLAMNIHSMRAMTGARQ